MPKSRSGVSPEIQVGGEPESRLPSLLILLRVRKGLGGKFYGLEDLFTNMVSDPPPPQDLPGPASFSPEFGGLNPLALSQGSTLSQGP